MKLNISIGNSRMDKRWNQVDLSLEDFKARIASTRYTAETVSQYAKMSKAQQDDIKDVGGFVMGSLKGGRRKKDCVIDRCGLTLDMDYATPNIIETVEILFSYHCWFYSTHKHKPDKPRLRLIIPLSRPVSPDEYIAIGRRVAADIGIELFDDTTYEPSRLMYWPSTSSDGEFIFHEIKGELLDPDEVLSRYKDWRNTAEWPVSKRQQEIVQRETTKVSDPLEKSGTVGAFCRAYSIPDAIETFLGDVYKPSLMPDRFDYIPADSQAGLVVYDDKFAYSHHATDPVHGRLLNAFDLVRLHRFNHLDNRAREDEDIARLPSFKAMQQFAVEDDQVKAVLAQERMEETQKEFTDENWQKALEHDRSGSVKDTLDNIVHILRYDPRLQGLAFDLHRDGIVARSHLPWEQIKEGWGDSDFASMKVYLNNTYGIYAPQKTKDAYVAIASERKFHPIKEFLSSLPAWDRVKRVDHLLVDFFGAENNAYTRAVMRKTLVAAVARVYRPGTKFDSVLILNGPQGIGKSTFFAKLAGNWFSDSLTLTEMRDKAGPEKLQGYWILELGELAGMRKADVETVKSFLSRTDDKYRASYGLNVESHPRQCVIVGSTNSESGFLRDITGNRRFWPVSVDGSGTRKPWELTKDEVEQIWAEALCMYKAGEKMFLEGDEAIMAQSQQAEAMETDDREGLIREYLEKLLPANWESMPLYDRRSFLGGHDFGGTLLTGTEQRQFVCNMEIWAECFSKDPAVMKKSDSYEISGIMNKIEGWRGPRTSDDRQVFGIYGRQRCYTRIPGQDGQAHTLSQDTCPIKTPVLT